jgi:hypothetical protein
MEALQRRRRNDAMLIRLLSDVKRARAAFRAGRLESVAASSRSQQVLRAAQLASAMESYADAAASTGVPLPYRYRDELRLYQAMTKAAVTGSELRQLADPQPRPRWVRAHGRDRSAREAAPRLERRAGDTPPPPHEPVSSAEERHQEAASARDFERRSARRAERLASSEQKSAS